MERQHRRRSAALLGTAALVASASTGFAVAAPGASATPASGAYSASAAADLVHLNLLNAPGVGNLADAKVAPVTSDVSTAATPRVTSHATNANVKLLSAAINQNLLVDAKQTAAPDNAAGVHKELLSIPAAPALTATIASADAHSRWNADDSCITNGPISSSISKVADAVVLPGLTGVGDLLSLNNTKDPSGAVVSATSVGLVKQPAGAQNYAVRTTSSTQVTSVNLLGGKLVVDVVTAPKVVATATGVPGTSTVELTQPVLRVNGTTYIAGSDLAPINIPGAPLIELKVGQLTKSISADGRTATGSGTLLSLKLIDVTGTVTVVDLTVADTTATATVPAGGVSCSGTTDDPLRDARKDTSATTVNPGQTFDYTVTVPNRGNADITDLKVVDTVTGSPALTLVKATPAADDTSGATYTFNLGTLAPNEVKTIHLTFKVPTGTADGTKYSNTAVITGTYGGKPVSKTVTTPYPSVDAPGTGACDLSRSTKFASHLEVRTGETFTYYVNVFNQGGKSCTGVEVKDALIDGVSFVSCTAGCTHSGADVSWSLGTVAPGESQQLAVTVKVLATSGTLPNTADVTADSGTPGHPHTPGPKVTSDSVLSPSNPATRSTSGNTGGQVSGGTTGNLASTGPAPLVALTGLSLLGLGAVLRRRLMV